MRSLTANYHTHTYRCGHASGADRDYVENAIRAGIATLGFSDHSPMIFRTGYYSDFRIPLKDVPGYFESLLSLREEYKNDIRILIGLEVEYYPACFADYLAYISAFPLDYKILGQHFFPEEETERRSFAPTEDPRCLQTYYETVLAGVRTGEFLYVAHPDVLHYRGDEAAYRSLTAAFLRGIAETGVPLELNRLGFFDGRHYPRREFWELAGETGVPAVIGLDAHDPGVLLDEDTVDALTAFAKSCGVRVLRELI